MGFEQGTTHYGVLGIDADATTEDIRRAYRARAKVAHPDAGGDAGQFRLILLAYETLVDDERREEYDRSIGIRRSFTIGTEGTEGGWAGRQGDFTGTVGFPAWMQGITDEQWRPPAEGEERETEFAAAARARHAQAARRHETPPADVVWWWPDRATAAPLVAGALLVVPAEHAVVALDPLQGGEAWRAQVAAPVVGPAVVCDDTVVVWTADGVVHGLELGRGVTRWELPVGPPAPGGLASPGRGGQVLATTEDAQVRAIDAATGARRWAARLVGAASQPAVFVDQGRMAVVLGGDRTIEGIETRRGRHRWRIALKQPVELPLCAIGTAVWLAGGGVAGGLVRLDAATGAVAGTFRAGTAIGGMATDGHFLYVTAAGPARVLAIDAGGAVHFTIETERVCPEPAVGRDHVYTVDPLGDLLTFHRASGAAIARTALPFGPVGRPQLIGDRLVLLARDGHVWAIRAAG